MGVSSKNNMVSIAVSLIALASVASAYATPSFQPCENYKNALLGSQPDDASLNRLKSDCEIYANQSHVYAPWKMDMLAALEVQLARAQTDYEGIAVKLVDDRATEADLQAAGDTLSRAASALNALYDVLGEGLFGTQPYREEPWPEFKLWDIGIASS